MELKGIAFDGDGVLFDTERFHVIAWKDIFSSIKIDLNLINFEEGIGIDDETFLKNLRNKGVIDKNFDIKKIVFEKNKKLLEIVKRENIEIPLRIKKVLAFLKKDYKIAIASNSKKEFILEVIKITGIEDFFDSIITRDDVKSPKPSPDIYIEVTKRLGLKRENIIAFEDSETGIIAAKSSGILCVGVLTTQRFEKLILADIIINKINLKTVKEVIKYFKEKK